jgi:iron complex transport system substrate-binding protein
MIAGGCGDDNDEGGGTPEAPTATEAPPSAGAFEPFDCEGEYPGTAPDDSAFPLAVTDDGGATVTFDEPPSAIVSLSAAHVVVLYAFEAGDQLVAGDLFSDCPAAAEELEQLDSFTPSVEAITALEPDLVLLFYDPGDLRDSLEAADIKVLALDSPADVEGVLDQIRLLGQVTGHEESAETTISGISGRIDEIVASLPQDEPLSVYHEVDNTFFSAGPGSFVADLYDILKAENIATPTGDAFPQLTQEAIIEAAPEVIILADEEAGESAETVSARPGWDAIPAVQNERIFAIDPDIVSRPGPRLVEALETLAELLYEE